MGNTFSSEMEIIFQIMKNETYQSIQKSLIYIWSNMTNGWKPIKSITDRPLYLCNVTASFQSQLSLTNLWSMKNRFQNVFVCNCKKKKKNPYNIISLWVDSIQ